MKAVRFLPSAVGLFLLSMLPTGAQDLSISEFLADNNRGLADEDGNSSDWIEVRNSGESSVDLAGYALTDDPEALAKWVFPSRTLAAGEALVVFASGKDRGAPGASELHTNFALDAGGGYLALVEPDGVTVVTEFVDYPEQFEDVSYGTGGGLIEQTAIADGDEWIWTAPVSEPSGWSQRVFSPAGWRTGRTGIGYETGTGYEAFIGEGGDTERFMFNRRSTVYMRKGMAVDSPGDIVEMTLRMRYDDGFVAFLNGRQVADANAPDPVAHGDLATTQHDDGLAVEWEEFDITQHADVLLNGGGNVLAIRGLNATEDSSDFLISAEVVLQVLDVAGGFRTGYLTEPTPGARNGESFEDFVADTKFSVNRGFYTTTQQVEITTETEGATIRYTTDGTEPTETNGTVYTAPVSVGTTTILRAAGFRDNWVPTNVDTQTYLFANQVVQQREMDRSVVNHVEYRNTIRGDLSETLPVVSLVVDDGDFFGPSGIHSNPFASGRAAEVPVSMEFFDPVDGGDFQIDAGIRIHGGNGRSHPKKPMRLYFRSEYGDAKLRYPLIPDTDVEVFDQLILRGGGHDSWSLAATFGSLDTDLPPHGTIMRDQFLRKTERDMGMLSPAGRYVHVYINGDYWGVYDIHERANAEFFSSNLGGDPEDWDVMHHPEFVGQTHVVVDGVDTDWNRMMTLLQRGVDSDADYDRIAALLEMDNYIDHMIVRMWSADYDWCGPIFENGQSVGFFSNKNWYAGRWTREGDGSGFRFFTWDAEMSMGLHLQANVFFPPPEQLILNMDMTRANNAGSPVFPYSVLKSWPTFQRRFGDRLYQHFFNGGAMDPAVNRARFEAMESQLERPMVGESARWGDEDGTTFLRNRQWRDSVNWLKDEWIRLRNDIVLDQFRAQGLYPDEDPPVFGQHGGEVAPGFELTMAAGGGAEIYYTTDGSDPYNPTQLVTEEFVNVIAPVSVLVPSVANGGSLLGETWTEVAPPANIGQWRNGRNGVGYESSGTNFAPLIRVNVGEMEDVNGSVFIRIPFTIDSQAELDRFDGLLLKMRYDDGFVAYLNGTEVEDENAPGVLAWDSVATDNHPDAQAESFETFDISFYIDELRVGDNVLAIHGLNSGIGSSDLLITATLEGVEGFGNAGVSPTAQRYEGPVTLDTTAQVRARARGFNGEWSALADATFLVGPLAGPDNLRISEVHYRPLGPETPEELAAGGSRSDFEFLELVNISAQGIDLTGARFDAGISWVFDDQAAVRTLGAGERLVLVSNEAAFLARYGAGLADKVAGEFRDSTRLANGGERLTLLAADGTLIHEVRFDDSDPWPVSPDGDGPSLVLVDPVGAADPADPAAWAASSEIGGSPGTAGQTTGPVETYAAWRQRVFDPAAPDFDVISAPDFDADGDGVLNVFEFISGRDPLVAEAAGSGLLEAFANGGGKGVSYVRVAGLGAPTVVVEVSSDFATWVDASGVVDEMVVDNGDGTETVVLTLLDGAADVAGFRLRANVTP